jgi:glycerophosphoryl diester phosphodiesterase
MDLVWHMARQGRDATPNTLGGIDSAIAAGAKRIEIDVRLLADGDAALFHESISSDGRAVGSLTSAEARAAGLSLLSDAVRRVAASNAVLQVDLKDEILLPVEKIAHLAELVAPLEDRVIVGSMIDWNLRQLRAAAPALRLGFDPLLYFHHWNDRPTDVPFPLQRGSYGYWDDHPLAAAGILPLRDYLTIRLDGLHAMVPGIEEIMLHYPTLLRAVDDGIDACRLLHQRGTRVLAWTLDADAAGAHASRARLLAAGVDLLVTNTPLEW